MKICFATHNENKLREVRSLMKEIEIVGLRDLGQSVEIPEDGNTLDENAGIKAGFVWDNYQINCFADDTGLEVDALDGAPGVYSARYAGEDKDSAANMKLLLENLEGTDNRKARFRTVIYLILNGETKTFEGVVNGTITTSLSGAEGFGYDPVFMPEGYNVTFAEMSMAEKNEISHRGKAIRGLAKYLNSLS
ncbi:MAG: non-canonical purine NTP diphosphatase [Cyclobacteriaceae bacterium]